MVEFYGVNCQDIFSLVMEREQKHKLILVVPIAILMLIFAVLLYLAGELNVVLAIIGFVTGIFVLVVAILGSRIKFKKNPFVDYSLRITITHQFVRVQSKITVLSYPLSEFKKVVDYGAWWELHRKSNVGDVLICEKNLMVEGTPEDFEKIFAGKIVKSDKYQQWLANRQT